LDLKKENNVLHLADVGRFLNASGSFRNYRWVDRWIFPLPSGKGIHCISGYFTWACWFSIQVCKQTWKGPTSEDRGSKYIPTCIGLYQINIQLVWTRLLRDYPLLNLSFIKPPRLSVILWGRFAGFSISVAPSDGWMVNQPCYLWESNSGHDVVWW
jgi:hypothetical protein